MNRTAPSLERHGLLGSLVRIALLFLIPFPAVAAQSYQLDDILQEMDKVGAKMQSMQADIKQKKWTALFETFGEEETGNLGFVRDRAGLKLRKDISSPSRNTLLLADGVATFFQPGLKQAQRYELGRNQDKAEFLLIGFGSDIDALHETYDVRLTGEEEVGDHHAVVLEFTPKSDKAAAFFSQIVMWVETEGWIPIQQKLIEPTLDYLLVRFQNIRINQELPDSYFRLKLDGVEVIEH